MHDIGKNRMRTTPSFKMNQYEISISDNHATPPFKMNQTSYPVPFTPLHEKILVHHSVINLIFN